MKTWWVLAIGIVGGLLGAGILLLAASPPRGEAVRLLPPPTPAPIAVHVAGAVANPGVYELPRDCRVKDAIEAAGGLLPEANPQSLNLAASLQDGDKVLVLRMAPTGPPPVQGGSSSPSTPSPSNTSGLVDINTATLEELDSLPGIGPVTAGKIIAYREGNGPFTSIEAIQDVSGIGPATFESIKDLITVDALP